LFTSECAMDRDQSCIYSTYTNNNRCYMGYSDSVRGCGNRNMYRRRSKNLSVGHKRSNYAIN